MCGCVKLEYWNIGVLEYWNIARLDRRAGIPSLRAGIPSLRAQTGGQAFQQLEPSTNQETTAKLKS
jgi:hypothetical protein